VAATASSKQTGVTWSDRLFDALPFAPIWIGAGIALALLVLFLLLSAILGSLEQFLARDSSIWLQRDVRLGVVPQEVVHT